MTEKVRIAAGMPGGTCDAASNVLDNAIEKARQHLLSLQSDAGYWAGELEADSSVTAGYVPLMHFMTGRVDPDKQRKVVNQVLRKQRSDGSWPSYYGGTGDLNVSVQDYFALKLAGLSPDDPSMRKGRQFILSRGGLAKTNTLTRVWLALFGQVGWHAIPVVPVELMLLPDRFPFSIYDFASWSRATIVALAVIMARKPVCVVADAAGVGDLWLDPDDRHRLLPCNAERFSGWDTFFTNLDRLLRTVERLPVKPGREIALRKAERWILSHQEEDGSWGGIMLPWVYSLFALKSLGYPLQHPVIEKGLRGIDGYVIQDADTLRLQPATSPVWDTAWAVVALRESGLPPAHPALTGAARWLLNQEVRRPGDWQIKNRCLRPGGWAFEFHNDFYPDIDDTAVVSRALRRVHLGVDTSCCLEAIERAADWSLRMQCDNGGWAAFDRNNDKTFLEHVPFADFMTPLDPTSPDVTAHMLELIGELRRTGRPMKASLAYVRRAQERDGAWAGRWGVHYVYGTGLVLCGLRAVGENMNADYVRKAIAWLASHQNRDGGWGETCAAYDDPDLRGTGVSTASQTGWALTGLLAAGEHESAAVRRGAEYLIQTQKDDGSWAEEEYTGTGFPRAFYLRYDLYRLYFPLLALAQYRNAAGGKR